MKKILSIVLALNMALVLTVLAGCSSGGGGDATTPPASEETPEATLSEPETPTAAPEATPDESDTPDTSDSSVGGLPENIADLTIILDGDTVTMFMQIEDFLTLGWEPEEDYR